MSKEKRGIKGKGAEEAKDVLPKNVEAAIAALRDAGAPEEILQLCQKLKSVHVGFDIQVEGEWLKQVPFLNYAVLAKNQKMVEILLDHGANVNLADSAGNTPLTIAIDNNYPEIVPVLFTKRKGGVNFNSNFFEVAAQRGQADVLAMFLSDPKISQISYRERTQALRHFVECGYGNYGAEKHAEVVQLFMRAGVDSKEAYEKAMERANTPAVGALYGQEERRRGRPGEAGLNRVILQYKKRKPENIDVAMNYGTGSSYREMFMLLLEKGANPAEVRHDSSTPPEFIAMIDAYEAEKRKLAAAPPPYPDGEKQNMRSLLRHIQ